MFKESIQNYDWSKFKPATEKTEDYRSGTIKKLLDRESPYYKELGSIYAKPVSMSISSGVQPSINLPFNDFSGGAGGAGSGSKSSSLSGAAVRGALNSAAAVIAAPNKDELPIRKTKKAEETANETASETSAVSEDGAAEDELLDLLEDVLLKEDLPDGEISKEDFWKSALKVPRIAEFFGGPDPDNFDPDPNDDDGVIVRKMKRIFEKERQRLNRLRQKVNEYKNAVDPRKAAAREGKARWDKDIEVPKSETPKANAIDAAREQQYRAASDSWKYIPKTDVMGVKP